MYECIARITIPKTFYGDEDIPVYTICEKLNWNRFTKHDPVTFFKLSADLEQMKHLSDVFVKRIKDLGPHYNVEVQIVEVIEDWS